MKYILFGGEIHYAKGGAHDFINTSECLKDLIRQALGLMDEEISWWHIINIETKKVITGSPDQAFDAPSVPKSILIPKDKDGTELVTNERRRQIQEEGWTSEHDDEHDEGQIAKAAACYIDVALTGLVIDDASYFHEQPSYNRGPAHWPWDRTWWKPSDDPIENLTKAGALTIAEIDRIKRKIENGI